MAHESRIRIGRQDDTSRLAVLATQVWLHTYATAGIDDEIAHYVLAEFTPDRFSARLNDPDTHVFVAEHGQGLVGVAVVRLGMPCPAGTIAKAELQTLYVQEHFIGQGVGKALLGAAEAAARQRSGGPLWLTVNARNARAIAFYGRRGYEKVGTATFVLGEGRHENHVLVGRGA